MKIHEFDAVTNETIIRDATAEELAQNEIDLANELAKEAEAQARAAAKESANAKLAALGLTAEEIAALTK